MEENFTFSSMTSINNQDNECEECVTPKTVEKFRTSSTTAANSKSSILGLQGIDESKDEKVWPCDSSFEDVNNEKHKGDKVGGTLISTYPSFASNWEPDVLLWLPPEPENIEDDIEDSVVGSYDDDDDYGDGIKWTRSSSLGSLNGEDATGNIYKKEREMAMMEAMNGQFKLLVTRLLASEGINCSKEDVGGSWLDNVTSLSWQTALLIKPDANEGMAMDPASYVKIKCVAHGTRNQSEVVKGLVFKKNTAHKHMSTNIKNPRLLLLKGALGEQVVGLSSFDAMRQELQDKDNLKSLIEMLEACHPNVILVEKTASRDVQEKLVEKGITLVFDMKLTRLERIARCTDSTIFTSNNIPTNTKLRHCDYFHIERFVEDHNQSAEGGKKTSKTLMFFEGCPKPLGCTILLKGAHSDELKKVKRVMHYTVFAAYHLILETSFFADQRALSFYPFDEKKSYTNQVDSSSSHASSTTLDLATPDESASAYNTDIPVGDKNIHKYIELDSFNSDIESKGYFADPATNGSGSVTNDAHPYGNSTHSLILQEHPSVFSLPLLPGQFVSSVSSTIKRTLVDHVGVGAYDYLTSYFVNHENNEIIQYNGINIDSPPTETANIEIEAEPSFEEEKAQDELSIDAKMSPVSDFNESLEHVAVASNKDDIPQKGDIDAVLDPQSILVLFSSRSTLKDTICEQSHLTRIKYYGNFDMSLGRFLRDILLSQKHNCVGCGASPEAHIYCYTHQNGKLTVQVKQLSQESCLRGATEGKIWMWTRCLKCQDESGIPCPTKRVVMSTAARGLSFGKFLELSFSSNSAATRFSICGHLLHRDCLRFFGLGSKVAMFRYSPAEIFTACKPPPLLDFRSPTEQKYSESIATDVQKSAEKLFSAIENFIDDTSSTFPGQSIRLPGSCRTFSELKEMLKQEKSYFENFSGGASCLSRYQAFDVTYLNQELLLALYVWDSRLQSLLSSSANNANSDVSTSCDEDDNLQDGDENPPQISGTCPMVVIEEDSSGQSHVNNTNDYKEKNHAEQSVEGSCDTIEIFEGTLDGTGRIVNRKNADGADMHKDKISNPDKLDADGPNFGHMQKSKSTTDLSPITNGENLHSEEFAPSVLKHTGSYNSNNSSNIMVEGPQDWIWNPFQDIRKIFWKDHFNGSVKSFGFIFSYHLEHLPPIDHLNVQHERERLCYTVDSGVLCVHEEEVSSIIACALLLCQERFFSKEDKGTGKDKVVADNEIADVINSVVDGLSSWSSTGSMNIEKMHSTVSLPSLDDLSTSRTESLVVDRLLSSENLHPEIHLGLDNILGKGKYSVVCIYAKKFYELRKLCCPSEMAYVSSLNRCKKWDAKGGKSKALFAKTLDDRFIIKEIKKTELASFLKFAKEYFNHVCGSLNSGSQTCLAKILGIYQVVQNKGGKEIKMDLLVMENLLFGRNISRTYDLKGAVFARYISDPDNPGAVLLDQNFVEDMGLSPMYIGGRTKHLLQRAIWNDTSFLTSINVMDYSLLVGVDKEQRQLVFGIIDYLRQYTWDKQLETWVKLSLVVPKNSLPTVVSPKEYKKRFRKFMSKYFLTVPDSWTTDRGSDACRSCTDGSIDDSQSRSGDFQEKSTESFSAV